MRFRIGIAAICLLAAAPLATFGGLTNPDFGLGLDGWTVNGDVSVLALGGDNAAVFAEGTGLAMSSIAQTFTVGSNDASLSFEYFLQASGTFSGGSLRDAFAAFLLAPVSEDPLLSTSGRNDYFYHQVPDPPVTPSVLLYDSANVTWAATANSNRPGWYDVTVDLTSLSGMDVLFRVGLLRGENGQSSIAAIDNLSVAAIPAPTAALLGTLGMSAVAALRRRLQN